MYPTILVFMFLHPQSSALRLNPTYIIMYLHDVVGHAIDAVPIITLTNINSFVELMEQCIQVHASLVPGPSEGLGTIGLSTRVHCCRNEDSGKT